ncbi:MAG: hypothetical protein ACK5AJ_02405 [bacterium]|jgi:hypothetical protein
MRNSHQASPEKIARIFLLIFLCAPLCAHAVYKCPRQGAIVYTDTPCEGTQLELPISTPSRSHETNQDRTLANDRAEVARLQKIREQRERQDQQIRDLSKRGAAAREHKCKTLSLQLRWREEDLREAPLQSQHKARLRVRRAAEKYAMECQ